MTVYTCDMPDCDAEYRAGERDKDSLFVSYSVSPHDVEAVDKRAFSVCQSCAERIDAELPQEVADE